MFECEKCENEFPNDRKVYCTQCKLELCEGCFGEDEDVCETCLEYSIEEAGRDAASEANETSCNDAADDLMDRF